LEQSGISAEDVGQAISSGRFSFAAVEMLYTASAVEAALSMVEGAQEMGFPPARVGFNAGPVVERDSDYFRPDGERRVPVAAYAGPRQVLVTESSCTAAGDVQGVTFKRIGPVRLKGCQRPSR